MNSAIEKSVLSTVAAPNKVFSKVRVFVYQGDNSGSDGLEIKWTGKYQLFKKMILCKYVIVIL